MRAFRLSGIAGLILHLGLGAEPARRLHAEIDVSRTFVLKGNTQPAIVNGRGQDQGEVAGSMMMPRLTLHFALTSAQQADLEQFLTALQNRRSPLYHRFLTPEEYGLRYGLNSADIAKIVMWLESSGFSNVQAARSRTWIGFNGTAGQVESAFRTAIHRYVVGRETHFANATDPQLPKALEGLALGMSGLHDFHLKPAIRLAPRYATPTGSGFLVPDDWQTIYDVKALYNAGWDGSPLNSGSTLCGGSACSIAVMGQSDVQASDLAAFRTAAHLTPKPVTVLIPPFSQDPGFQGGNENESDLDLEWANAIAPNANVLFVTTDFQINNGVEDSMAYAIDNNVAPIVTMSYGVCEAALSISEITIRDARYQQANTQGMTVVAASGDLGAAGCDYDVPPSNKPDYPATLGLAVVYPASSAYVTGVGGTTLYSVDPQYWSSSNNSNGGSALGYSPEDAWNDYFYYQALVASGGGASNQFAKPSWQQGLGVPNDGKRDVPDIALAASPSLHGYLVCPHSFCVNGFSNAGAQVAVTGGTSAGTPSFGGVLALLVQKNGAPLGNINPNLYTLAQAAPDALHDILLGDNIVPCVMGTPDCDSSGRMGFSAGVGYDQATGLGSIDAFNLVEKWGADIQMTASPTTVTVAAGSSVSATVTVGPLRGFTGAISFGCTIGSGLANVTCSVPATTVNTSGTVTATISASSVAHVLPKRPRVWPTLAMGGLAFTTLALMLVALGRQRNAYAWGGAIAVVLLVGVMVSCGGTSSSGGATGPQSVAESGNVIVTATSGQIRNQVVIAVSVP